MTSTKKRFR